MTPASPTLSRDTPTTVRSLLFSARGQQGWMLLLVALGVIVTIMREMWSLRADLEEIEPVVHRP